MSKEHHPTTYTRRELLAAGAALAVTACSSGSSDATANDQETTRPAGTDDIDTSSTTTTTPPPTIAESPGYSGSDPFRLGVASGDPDSTSVVLWTRLLPDDQTLGDADQPVAWEMSTTVDFDTIVASGTTVAPAKYAHSVHLLVDDLEVDNWYWYRFRVGDHTSAVGRARTTPAPSSADELRFGFSSCQMWETGGYAAHRHAAEIDDLDLFVWLGDYMYEYGPNPRNVRTAAAGLREHDSDEVVELDEYRARYALYRSDPHLQANHAKRPWVVTWDDHEVDNNYAGLDPEDGQQVEEFAARQIAAHQAWWEHMPVRLDAPDGQPLSIHRTISWGGLVDLHMLDGRQYRDPVATDGAPVVLPGVGDIGVKSLGPTALDPDHSMLGAEQEAWLVDQITGSDARWTVLGNQVYMHGITALPGDPAINTDTWDGYFGNRKRLLEQIDEATSGDLVVLSGDFHASTAAALRADPFDLELPVVGTEFMAPAISSQFPEQLRDVAPLALAINTHVADFSDRNGLMICTVTKDRWVTERVDVVDHRDENSAVATAARYTVQAGVPGVIEVEST